MTTNTAAPVRASRLDRYLLALLAASLVTNVVLGVSVLRLAGRTPSSGAMRSVASLSPAVGARLPPLDARRTDGAGERLTFDGDGRPTLLYVFAPTCRWCARNLDNVKAVFTAAEKTHRIVALSLAAEAGSAEQDLPKHVRVLVQPSPAAFEPYRLGSTPATYVISPEGQVLKVWLGAYTGLIAKEVESYFGLRLPGLVRDPVN